jgi:hypothetical protein
VIVSRGELLTEMLKSGVNLLPGSERIRLEMDEATASYDGPKATKEAESSTDGATKAKQNEFVVLPIFITPRKSWRCS